MSDEWKKGRDGVYYDFVHDHLVLLQWLGNRFYLDAEFTDVTMKVTSKREPSTIRAGLIFIGEL